MIFNFFYLVYPIDKFNNSITLCLSSFSWVAWSCWFIWALKLVSCKTYTKRGCFLTTLYLLTYISIIELEQVIDYKLGLVVTLSHKTRPKLIAAIKPFPCNFVVCTHGLVNRVGQKRHQNIYAYSYALRYDTKY